MTSLSFSIRLEQPDDASTVEKLTKIVFGPGMVVRAAFALRDGVPAEPALSIVAECDGEIIGSVRQTQFLWGGKPALMLGPLGVLPQYKSKGVGKALMNASVDAARKMATDGGPEVIMLVGDFAYYAPFGFRQVSKDKIDMPRPVDPQRILACELVEGALKGYSGVAEKLNC